MLSVSPAAPKLAAESAADGFPDIRGCLKFWFVFFLFSIFLYHGISSIWPKLFNDSLNDFESVYIMWNDLLILLIISTIEYCCMFCLPCYSFVVTETGPQGPLGRRGWRWNVMWPVPPHLLDETRSARVRSGGLGERPPSWPGSLWPNMHQLTWTQVVGPGMP